MLNSLARQATLILAIRSLFFCVRAIALLLLAKLLPPETYGGIILLFTVLEIGRVLADFGIDTRLTGDFARLPPSDHPALFRRALAVKVIAALLLMPIIAAFISWQVPAAIPHLYMVSTLPCVVVVSFSVSYMQARQAILKSDLSQLLVLVMTTLAVFSACVWFGNADLLFVSILVFEVCSAGLILSSARNLIAGCGEHCTDPVSFLSLFLRVLPVGLTSIIATVYGRLDLFIAQKFAPAATFGQYSLINRISEPLIMVAGTVAIAYYVRVAQRVTDTIRPPDYLRIFASRYFFFALGCALGFSAVSVVCIHFLPEYQEALGLIPYAALAVIAKVMNQGVVAQLSGHSRYQSILLIAVFNFAMMSCTLLLFVTLAGLKGCLIAIALTECLSTALMLRTLSRVLQIRVLTA